MSRFRIAAGLVLIAGVAAGTAGRGGQAAALQEPFELLIRGGQVLDGTGNPWRYADLGIRGGRIAAMGDLTGGTAARVLEAAGLTVAPGFIDVHSHAGPGLAGDLHHARPLLAQGLTTVVVNHDGGGPFDLAAQRANYERRGIGVNVGLLVPHGSIRAEVMGMADREPTPAELDRMQELTKAGMEAGGLGLSTGLFYAPGSYASTGEVIALARVAAGFGGVYASHIRDEGDYTVGLLAAVDEVIRIAEVARLPGIVSHMKALGPANWGLGLAATMRIEAARARGIPVFADQYPYEASGTSVAGALVPRWALVGGAEALRARLRSPDRARLGAGIRQNIDRRGGASTLLVSRFEPDPSLEGRTLAEIARDAGRAPEEAAMELLDRGGAGLVSFNMNDKDIEHIMRQTYMMTCTDGDLVPMGQGKPHPRAYGAFPRKLRVYVRERGVVDWAFAVRSMTSLPASVFGLKDRGVLRQGARADVVVFDPARVGDRATYADPHQLSEGIVHVLVNGRLAVDAERFTGALPGVVVPPERR